MTRVLAWAVALSLLGCAKDSPLYYGEERCLINITQIGRNAFLAHLIRHPLSRIYAHGSFAAHLRVAIATRGDTSEMVVDLRPQEDAIEFEGSEIANVAVRSCQPYTPYPFSDLGPI